MQIQQLDFISERRRWEAEKARQAPRENEDAVEELLDDAAALHQSQNYQHASQFEQGMTEADYVAAQEEYELQQLVASMEQESDGGSSENYGSDDDDYDSIFMECAIVEDVQYRQQGQYASGAFDCGDDMDIDMTDG